MARLLVLVKVMTAFHITAPAEDGRGAYNAMINALNDFKESPTLIDYINAHGTSTSLGT